MADVSLAALALRLVVSMAVVVALMLVAAKALRRTQGRLASGGGSKRRQVLDITVVAQQALSRHASVAVVHHGGRELVVGVTDQQVTLLAEGIAPRIDDEEPSGSSRSRRARTTTVRIDDEPAAAGIAADGPSRFMRSAEDAARIEKGMSAWTEALEALRERTVRR